MKRLGAAKGTGSGYRNLRQFPKDSSIHAQSAKGMKQPQFHNKIFRIAKPRRLPREGERVTPYDIMYIHRNLDANFPRKKPSHSWVGIIMMDNKGIMYRVMGDNDEGYSRKLSLRDSNGNYRELTMNNVGGNNPETQSFRFISKSNDVLVWYKIGY